MNYVYAALLLHSADKPVDEEHLKKVVAATGAHVDEARVKALVAALEGVNIEEAISKAIATPVAAAPVAAVAEKKEEKASEEEMEKKAEAAAEGLSSLFG
jgi:large subunit ribosomal protein L12